MSETQAATAERTSAFLVDRLLPQHELHLIYGPIAHDNSLLALQLLDDWSAGADVFGEVSHPVPFCYVGCERSISAISAGLGALGIDDRAFPFISLIGVHRTTDVNYGYGHELNGHEITEKARFPLAANVDRALANARQRVNDLQLLVLDGMYSLALGKTNDYREAAHFLTDVVYLCRHRRVTILGIVSTVKSREGEGYTLPQHRIHGSGAWGSISQTQILIEPGRPSQPTDLSRRITVMPPFGGPQLYQYTKDAQSGRLLLASTGSYITGEMDAWFTQQSAQETFSTQELLAICTQRGISRATLYRWIDTQVVLGTLERLGRGQYRRPGPPAGDNTVAPVPLRGAKGSEK